MTGLAILDLVIGVIFIYFLLSILCSAIQEVISGILRLRAKTLNAWLRDAFAEGGLGQDILKHKLIDGLTEKGRLAAYFPPDKFAIALLDIVFKKTSNGKPYTVESLSDAIRSTDLLHDDFKSVLLQAMAKASGDIDAAKKFIESWFNDSMERVTGTYRKKVRLVVLIISIVATVALNADTIAISNYLYDHPEVSKQLANQAAEAANDQAFEDLVKRVSESTGDTLPLTDVQQATDHFERNIAEAKAVTAKLDSLRLPVLGWKNISKTDCTSVSWWLAKIIGLFLTAAAVSLGAPFWFDILGKLANLRSAGRDPSKPNAPK